MVKVSVGDVVFVRFPFSDLSASKKRPALVLATLEHGDIILCQITSKPYADQQAIQITDTDFKQGSLLKISYVRPGKLFTANTSIIDRVAAKLTTSTHQSVVLQIIRIIS